MLDEEASRTVVRVPRRWLWWLGAVILGCGPGNADLRAKLQQRAAFDLHCDAIQLVPLERTGSTVVSYGALGCGRQVSYALNVHTSSWLMQGSPTKIPPAGESPGGDSSRAASEGPPREPGDVTLPRPEPAASADAEPGGSTVPTGTRPAPSSHSAP